MIDSQAVESMGLSHANLSRLSKYLASHLSEPKPGFLDSVRPCESDSHKASHGVGEWPLSLVGHHQRFDPRGRGAVSHTTTSTCRVDCCEITVGDGQTRGAVRWDHVR